MEFYGFNKITPIREKVFKEFYIEDDKVFIDTIKNSSFPQNSYSDSFRG